MTKPLTTNTAHHSEGRMPRKSTGGASTSTSAPGTPLRSAPRKSDGGPSTPSIDTERTSSSTLSIPPATKLVLKQQETALKGIDTFELPRSNIIRCAKTDLPDTVSLRKDVQSALVKSATIFISYLTSIAHDNATKKGGKIIAAQHVLDAVKEVGWDGEEEVVRELKEGLRGYRDGMAKKKAAAAEAKRTEVGEEADESRVEGEGDESVRVDAEGGDVSKSLNGHAGDDEEEGEGTDQLMDED